MHHNLNMPLSQTWLSIPFLFALGVYLAAVVFSNKPWPHYRTFLWVAGVFCALAAVTGPLAFRSHHDFAAHMICHLHLGMLAPLLMVIASPMTLILRTLHVSSSRRLIKLLRNRYFRFICNPVVASFLNIGGLWLLYRSGLFMVMHQYTWLFVVVHLHVFFAGYIFTVSMIYCDPIPHRSSFLYRAIMMVFAFAGHGILSKYIYAHPPDGVPADQAQIGAMLMYYGGDASDLFLIIIFCWQWYRDSRPRASMRLNHLLEGKNREI